MFINVREALQAASVARLGSRADVSAVGSRSALRVDVAVVAACALSALILASAVLPRGAASTAAVAPGGTPAVAAFEALRQVEVCGEAQQAAGLVAARFGLDRVVMGRSYLTVSADRPGCGGASLVVPLAGLDAAGREAARHLAAGFQAVVQDVHAESEPATAAAVFRTIADEAGLPARVTVSLSR